jgi:protein-tyrosine phosphatase
VSEIFWIRTRPKVGLAIVLCPRGDDLLKPDLIELKQGGIDTLVSMLEEDEAAWLGLRQEAKVAQNLGMRFVSFPIPDRNVPPDRRAFNAFISDLASRLVDGAKIGVHCRGCIGRSTVTTASVLILLGFPPKKALSAIQAARGCTVPDTLEQERWIFHFKPMS